MNLISIIVCTYNQEDTIGRCLDAILSQESPWSVEVIIGEDGSRDNTRSICEGYERKYPSIVRLMPKAPNKGILQNYFDCVRAAKGKYIMECGGDDVWMPGRIKMCLEIMEAHEDVGMVITPKQSIDEETGKELPLTPSPWHEGLYSGEELTYQYACAMHCYPGDSAMTRLSMLRKAMEQWPQFFNGREYQTEDMQIPVTMGFMGKMYYLDTPTFYYYVCSNSISQGPDEGKRLRFATNCLKLLLALTNDVPMDKERVMPAIEHRVFAILMNCFRLHDKQQREASLIKFREWGIPIRKKALAVKLVTSNALSWNLFLFLRKVFVLLKRLKG